MSKRKQMQVIPFYDDLHEALEQEHCALCRLLVKHTDRYIDGMLYEMVNDPPSREVLIASRGFCHRHAWMMVRNGAALGTTIIMNSVLQKLIKLAEAEGGEGMAASGLDHLRNAIKLPRKDATESLEAALIPQEPCPVCKNEQHVERDIAHTLLDHMVGDHSLEETFAASAGLCLPHFKYTLNIATPSQALQNLVSAQKSIWERLQAELAEFIRKNDHRFTHEEIGAEGDAWKRSLAATSSPPVEAFWTPASFWNRR
ncbi:MAG: DUF6062 family protein [Chloroflexota bacterium]